MGDVKGVGGTCAPQNHGDGSSSTNVTTVKQGETSLRKVAERLSKNSDKEYGKDAKEIQKDLEKANPNLKNKVLTAGQDICLPPKKEGGSKVPEGRVGDYKVPLPKPTPSTDDTYDRGGTSSNRKQEQDRLDGTRPRDERDLDPKQIEKQKKQNLEPHKRVVEREMERGMKEAEKGTKQPVNKGNEDWRKQDLRDQMDDMIRKQKFRMPPR